MDNDDILFYWSMLIASWEEGVADKILTMIVDLWITIRGFLLASAWVEEFKLTTKRLCRSLRASESNCHNHVMFCCCS